jgi:phosphatidylglycerophosphate synthase
VSWTGWTGAGLGAAGVAILAWTAVARTPPRPRPGGWAGGPGPRPGSLDAYREGWRRSHLLGEGDQPGGRVAAAYLRLPYRLAAPLARAGTNPNLVTLAALWLAGVAGWAATLGPGWAAAAGTLTLLAGLADSVDGAVAVLAGRATRFGFVWDALADRLADLALVAGPVLLVAAEAGGGWPALAVTAGAAAALLGLLLEFIRARAQAGGVAAARRLVTPGERPTRLIVLGLTGLAVGAAQLAGGGPGRAAVAAGYPLALLAVAALEGVGCLQLLLAAARSDIPHDRT